ncbi:unnamed protein product [Cuscuta europaea]|uniref:Uncharacterized protein n=1 Tax=Cuscuta europaea TaxID=41803 RepID=A0A9P0ZL06_CUSEU|nr:unnamed protein product [Cuscuta europaea]
MSSHLLHERLSSGSGGTRVTLGPGRDRVVVSSARVPYQLRVGSTAGVILVSWISYESADGWPRQLDDVYTRLLRTLAHLNPIPSSILGQIFSPRSSSSHLSSQHS